MAIVYCATNKINGNKYIGATKCTLKKRKLQHIADAKSGRMTSRIFHRAIMKYGVDAFEWNILVETETREDALLEEIRFIAESKPEYNIAPGGQGNSGFKLTQEALEAISKPVTCITDGKEYPSGAAACRTYGISGGRMSIICRKGGSTKGLRFKFADGEEPPLQVYRSPEAIEKYKIGVEAGRQKAIDKCRISIVCIDTGEKFRSVIDATERFGFRPSTLYSALRRGHKCGGYLFAFADEMNGSETYSTRDPFSSASHGARRVICLNDNMLFDSVTDASAYYRIGRKPIDEHLKGKRHLSHVYGMKFSYLDEWCPNSE